MFAARIERLEELFLRGLNEIIDMVGMPRATLFFVQGGLKWLFAASGFEKKPLLESN
jgi:hypothetical protein